MSQVYPPTVIIRTLIEDFFPYRGLAPAARGLSREADPRAFSTDEVISDMEQFGYVRLDALRAAPRGQRDWVVVLVLAAESKFALHSPDLRKLLEGVLAERPSREGRLDELIVVAEEDFFLKKHLTDVIRERQEAQAGGADLAGAAPFFSAHRYYNFALNVPASRSVRPHRIMGAEELATFLRGEHLSLQDLPTIYTTDAPLIWLGAREGQVVEIERSSQTAAVAFYKRRVVSGDV
jgi:DNA-directed RNA polymerase subunit H (RpoH/RPB5)